MLVALRQEITNAQGPQLSTARARPDLDRKTGKSTCWPGCSTVMNDLNCASVIPKTLSSFAIS